MKTIFSGLKVKFSLNENMTCEIMVLEESYYILGLTDYFVTF